MRAGSAHVQALRAQRRGAFGPAGPQGHRAKEALRVPAQNVIASGGDARQPSDGKRKNRTFNAHVSVDRVALAPCRSRKNRAPHAVHISLSR